MLDTIKSINTDSNNGQQGTNDYLNASRNGTMDELQRTIINGEVFYCIRGYDRMRPFFMNIVSDTDLWMFISSKGGLSAGRINADHAIFPYYTDDKITDLSEVTGSLSWFKLQRGNGESYMWRPFLDGFGTNKHVERNIYKSIYNNKVIFEERHLLYNLRFRYGWYFSDHFGLVREAELVNESDTEISINMLDGVQNILPAGVTEQLQNWRSNLVNAYRKSELANHSNVGIYSFSARIIDKPEPSESLRATTAWSVGWENPTILLSTQQVRSFINGINPVQENDMRAEPGGYLLHKECTLGAGKNKKWLIVLETDQGVEDIIRLQDELASHSDLFSKVHEDIHKGNNQLHEYLLSADGIQESNDHLSSARHLSNVLFNSMRGGLFPNGYTIDIKDFCNYLHHHNKLVAEAHVEGLLQQGDSLNRKALLQYCEATGDVALYRLTKEYLPLFFSRRHGDPSRPWNVFNINTRGEDGSRILDYEGNWRDIFQNWEALAVSFPGFIDAMIARFLNASTADGYNPYRITRNGIDWEIIEPHDPWSFIGYWGDHQIIYLLKLLELSEKYYPGQLAGAIGEAAYCFANVPYRIQPFEAILRDPQDTIVFDDAEQFIIDGRVEAAGADGKLLWNCEGIIIHTTLGEKLLIPLLAKLSNYIHEGGIWLNTQRPEWNDANNALVGNGVSMVTLNYLRRYIEFLQPVFRDIKELNVASEVKGWLQELRSIFEEFSGRKPMGMDNDVRMEMINRLGHAAQHYNQQVYAGLSGYIAHLSGATITGFFDLTLTFIDYTIAVNKRQDKLFHAYNLLSLNGNTSASVQHMYLMLEGQVAALSSGTLSTAEAVALLDALKESALYRDDHYSYLLYPDRQLKPFLERNNIPAEQIKPTSIIPVLADVPLNGIVQRDIHGNYHFYKNLSNADDLKGAIEHFEIKFGKTLDPKAHIELLYLFEMVFQHEKFTGRSGTFYGYEGLNCIYWHMVSKLLLAVQEQIIAAHEKKEPSSYLDRLVEHYYEIRAGIGLNKTPELYGAFPTDPYSHTPGNKGAQQPGMTGQVKEDIITRFGELGVSIEKGCISFSGRLLRQSEFIPQEDGSATLTFTFCAVPVVYKLSKADTGITIHHGAGDMLKIAGATIPAAESRLVFERNGGIRQIEVNIQPELA